jgi:hypothetical protein
MSAFDPPFPANKILSLLAATLLLSGLAAPPLAVSEIVADSVAEFSDAQGQDGWFYGRYTAVGDSDSFSQITPYNAVDDLWRGTESFQTPLVGALGAHPGADSGDWAVRRWVSTVAGTVEFDGSLHKTPAVGIGGDGVVGHILVDGVEVFSQFVDGSDTVGVDYSFSEAVAIGSTVDIALSWFSTPLFDSTDFNVCVSTLPLDDCGDPNGEGGITATDALFVLRASVGLEECCLLAVCAVTGGVDVVATDALLVLRVAVGLAAQDVFDCP